MSTAKELREEFSRIHTEAEKVVNDAIAAGTELTAELKDANDKRFARLASIKNLLDEHAKFAKLAIEGEAGVSGVVITERQMPGQKEVEQFATLDPAKIDRKEFAKAAAVWAATGSMNQKFATITTATQSGLFLPVEVAQPLVPVAINTFPMRGQRQKKKLR